MRSPSLNPIREILPKQDYVASILVPSSKSRANRLLFLAAVDERAIRLENLPDSSDVVDMLRCLKTIGLSIHQIDHETVVIENSFPACEDNGLDPIVVPCGYGGTTTRFLAALLTLGKRRYHLEAEGHMRQRPMSEMIAPIQELGVEIKLNSDDAWIVIQGPVKHKLETLNVDTSRSTQFASALAMTASTWGGTVKPQGLKASEDYFAMTLDCIARQDQTTWQIPADFSSLSYPIALAAIGGQVRVKNIKKIDPYQPDSRLIEILKEMGADILWSKDGLQVRHAHRLKAWSGDCSRFPDLVPTLAFLCACAAGESELKNLSVLKHKESDRFSEIMNILKLFDIQVSAVEDNMKIMGTQTRHTKQVNYLAPDDHRMIMLAALFMRVHNGGFIENWKHIKKSYPYFFDDVIDQ